MIEQAQIIYNIIKGVDEGDEKESDEESEKHQIQNEYSWKFKGGNQVLDELDRSQYDSDYVEDGEGLPSCKYERDQMYLKYKEKIEDMEYTNDLFSN